MQGNDMGRVEPFRPSSFSSGRGTETPAGSLPDVDAFRLGGQFQPAAARIAAVSATNRRERYPDAEETRNGIFEQLVSGDEDVAGLIAYSIYKQNKRDWLRAFDAAKNRAPTLDEEAAYTLGEATPRRLAMYRHIALETLAGQGPVARPVEIAGESGYRAPPVDSGAGAAGIRTPAAASSSAQPAKSGSSLPALVIYAGILALAGFGLWVGLRTVFPALFH